MKESVPPEAPKPPPGQVQLKLKDGARMTVDDAWESEQGIWYKQNGVTHLVSRERVAAIERGDTRNLSAPAQVASVAAIGAPSQESVERRTWIYLVGGARMEVENADESPAGVWYHRGSLAIFVDRSRIDHLEREELEKAGESDSSSTKELRWSTGNAKIDSLIKQNGARHGVDPYLIFCVMEQESHFGVHAVSPKGARGLMQLMPGTGARFGVRHPFNAAENISAGTRYLKQLIARFNGRVDLVLASYNAGEGAVLKFGHRVPPYAETKAYVKRISYRYRRTKVPQTRNPAPPAQTAGGN